MKIVLREIKTYQQKNNSTYIFIRTSVNKWNRKTENTKIIIMPPCKENKVYQSS